MTDGHWREVAGSPLEVFRDSPPPAGAVQVEFGANTCRSPLRPISEDHYLILCLGRHQETLMTSLSAREVPPRFDEYGYAMVVADGVGGSGGGEIASRLAITTLVHLATYFGRWNVRIDDDVARQVIARADQYYRGVDSALLQRSHGRAPGLQTTLTAAYSAGRDLFLAHVGHSRAYLLHRGRLTRLTRDQTVAHARPRDAVVDFDLTARDLHHVLTETLGGAGEHGPAVHIDRCRLADGDVVMLCSNGLSDMVSEDQIAEVLDSPRTPREQCASLVSLAVDAGGADDVTVVAARYRIPEGA